MRFTAVFYLLVFNFFASQGQLVDNFDDGSFPADPEWVGNVSDFKVNENGQLQLDAADGGESNIFSQINFPEDTISFSFKFNLGFDPSNSNQLRIFLSLDDTDLATASGYYLKLGETGSDDAILFYRLESGESILLASGSIGAVSNEPDVNLRVDVFPNGLWSILADYNGGTFLEEDLVLMDETYSIYGPRYFGFGCKYTSSRSDLFFFDDVNINLFEEDKEGPNVIDVNVIDNKSIEVTFSEPVDPVSSIEKTNYRILPEPTPNSVVVINPTKVLLSFDTNLPSDESFTLEIDNVVDLFENEMPTVQSFVLNFARKPEVGDIIINEILFASLGGGEDFVEVRSLTDDFLDLSGAILGNDTKTDGNMKLIVDGTVLEPRGYLAFTEEKALLEALYQPTDLDNISEQDIPDFNNDNGNVFISNQDGELIDSYDYDEDQHYELLAIVKGVSLERKGAILPTNDVGSWTSASQQVNFATPGYENSSEITNIIVEDNFEFVTKVFSPDADNNDDEMLLGYNLDKAGYVGSLEVRNVNGYLIKSLINNESLSTSGLISWNGLDNEGKVANIGMYIIVGEFFHPDGDGLNLKKVCVLAGQFN